ncbi:MAG: DUF2277 family protein [Deltaproteobacteria bacterium]|nr:DUF2277 family protein [Deltaproteobacteria bacterium]
MCRDIRVLFHFQPPTTDDEIAAAALQYVRKVSGSTRPSRANQAAFDAAVAEKRDAQALRRLARQQPAPSVEAVEERVYFLPHEAAAPAAEAAFVATVAELSPLVPAGAEWHHVGATAIPGSLTKGDLDICVRVSASDFVAALDGLRSRLSDNAGSDRSDTYQSLNDDARSPPLGVQLVVRGGPEDFFLRLRDAVRADPAIVEELNAIRRRFEGGSMHEYRLAKGAVYERLLNSTTTTGL